MAKLYMFYHSSEKGRPDLERPLDPTLILDKDFIKSEIPQAPAAWYTGQGDNYSKVSLDWLKWMDHDMGKPLQSALSDEGEHVIRVGEKAYQVDGFEKESSTVLEFDGVSNDPFHSDTITKIPNNDVSSAYD